ncbi:Membrane-associated lipoprotein precursor [Mesomycoplasma conjunctivae]|uniref:DUF31 domain-containing protein n=1 Tax=Mesomycoplasma conjunctivae (strain ATCC 25834 / NCTC 10147 / HRC/581) TaxID=572263 RepID=C5J6E6_MESCH|nr:DUF31 family protein [Mesomycoplasma conjunctivae]CAT05038.1 HYPOTHETICAL PROTEIN MCJ_003490 [Mesomycoplasma conjunctivae]VEU66304.1 Membrane-associated lipoprotein precursor [Mesomycoplasma conjunctivae]
MKIKKILIGLAFAPVFALVACGVQQKVGDKKPTTPTNNDQTTTQLADPKRSQKEALNQKITNLSNGFFSSEANKEKIEKFIFDLNKIVDEDIAKITSDEQKQQQLRQQIKDSVGAFESLAKTSNYTFGERKQLFEQIVNTIKANILEFDKPQPPRPVDPPGGQQRREPTEQELKEFDKFRSQVAPRGQNVTRVDKKTNLRIVEDQYEHDRPKNEQEYYALVQGGDQAIINRPPEQGLAKRPTSFVKPADNILKILNEKARAAGQPLYENAQERTFSLPTFDASGNPNGLHINNYEQGFTSPAFWGDTLSQGGPGRVGLPRILANDQYKKLSKAVVSLQITNGKVDKDSPRKAGKEVLHLSQSSYGTAQIIDYKLEDGVKYPLTWYFLTNAHVANSLRLHGDSNENDTSKAYGRDFSNYNTNDLASNTWSIALRKLKQDQIPLKSRIQVSGTAEGQKNYSTVSVRVKEKDGDIYNNGQDKENNKWIGQKPTKQLNVRTIVIGTDTLKSSPKDFSKQENFKDFQEVLDYAIIEVTFDNEADAKAITQDYYNDSSQHFKVSDTNLLNEQNYKKFQTLNIYGLGFPNSKGELNLTLNEFDNKEEYEARNSSVSLYTNKNFSLYKNTEPENLLYKDGGDLSWSRSYRSFINLPGLTDLFISTPVLSDSLFKVSKFEDGEFKSTPYLMAGQATLLDNFSVPGGGSGSPVKLGDNSAYSILFASDARASAGLTLNLRSYGYDYKGYYGKYKLAQYDVIYGSDNQRKSYWDAMNQLYKSDSKFKTNLFKNGFADDTKVDVFKTSELTKN